MDSSNNNSFGGMGVPVISSSPADGPVFVGGGSAAEKKPKKWLIAVIVVVAVAVLAGIVALAILKKSGGSSTVDDVKNSFYKFANYVLSGEDNSAAITASYNVGDDYYFLVNQNTPENQKKLYANTSKLLKDFKGKYDKLPAGAFGDKSQEIGQNVDDIVSLFDFMEIVYTKKRLFKLDIRDMYLENGYDGAYNEALAYYGGLNDSENSYIAGFSELFKMWVKDQLDILEDYNKKGCIVDKTVNLQCVYDKVQNAEGEKVESGFNRQGELNSYYNMNANFIVDIFMVNALMNNESLEGLVTGGGDE